ncbi:MAG TPA: F0F1 ATP synthase subunit delta [Nocardioidaceae bacterium]|nr:F0F1 ATP synthase subunit delta [Nocardioidaceae bacterium]
MQAGSQRSMAAVLEKANAVLESDVDADKLGDELFAFALTLDSRHSLRRALTEPAVPADAKSTLLHRVAEGKIAPTTLEVVDVAVRLRWSQGRDLADALEHASVTAHVAKADSEGHLDDLEDNLFRFARIVDAHSGLREALADPAYPLEGKRKLLDTLLEGKVGSSTEKLLDQAAAARHRSLPAVLDTYQKIAAERRDRLVATVWVAADLSTDHRGRLAAALSRQYDHDVHLNVIVDPEVLGGVRVAVGDEVIDSTVQTRLRQAHRRLEH